MAKMTRLLGFLALLLLLNKPAVSTISCSSMISKVTPCVGYIDKSEVNPSQTCCNGVKSIADEVKNKADRQAACNCLKKTLSTLNYDSSCLPELPKKCGANISLPPIDHNTDCSEALN